MHRLLLLGAGKIGTAIATLLQNSGDYDVLVADAFESALDRLKEQVDVKTMVVDASDAAALKQAMQDRDSVMSALSFAYNPLVAEMALECGLNYFDLTEDVETTRAVKRLAEKAKPGQVFMPQCGLAPGFVSIVAHDLTTRLEKVDTVRMRVGALPLYPSNSLKYNLTWSTDGLINEYCNPCEAILHGEMTEVLALEGLEHFSVDGVRYEAFNTSGGLGTLCETLDGQVSELNYKTVRYNGHRELADFLVNGLKMRDKREQLREILEDSIPMTLQDVVIVFCVVTGMREGRLVQITDARKVYHREIYGKEWSAIQITTASGICAVLDMVAMGQLEGTGLMRQEQVNLSDFLKNRFGMYYDVTGEANVLLEPAEPPLPKGEEQSRE